MSTPLGATASGTLPAMLSARATLLVLPRLSCMASQHVASQLPAGGCLLHTPRYDFNDA